MEDLKTIIRQKFESAGFNQISDTAKGKLEGYEFLLSVFFPSAYRRIFFYKESAGSDQLIIEFIGMPEAWRGFRIGIDELDGFVKDFLLPASTLLCMPKDVMASLVNYSSTNLHALGGESSIKFKYFIGYFVPGFFYDLHYAYIQSPFVGDEVFHQPADPTGFWLAAQYRTVESASVLNFEGFKISEAGMLYYVSGSYLPTGFNVSRIIGRTEDERVGKLPPDAPVDLAGAFETISLGALQTRDELLHTVLHSENWALAFEALYYMLDEFEFKHYFSTILDSPDLAIRDAAASRAILRRDADVAKLALIQGISREMEEKLIANNLI